MIRRFIGGVLFAPMVLVPAWAESPNNSDPALLNLDPVNIDAPATFPATNENNISQISPISDSADALRVLPSVSGSRMGGHGTDLSIRGLSQTRVNILVDGAYIHGACPNRMDPPSAYASGYDEVTLIRGVQTLEYGTGGGATVLFERESNNFAPEGEIYGGAEVGFRSNSDTWQTGVNLNAGNKYSYLHISGNHTNAKNYKDGAGNEVRSAYRETDTGLAVGVNTSKESVLEFSYDRQFTRDLLYAGAGMDSPIADSDAYKIKWENEGEIGPFDSLKAELYRTEVEHVMDSYTLRTSMMQMRAPSTSDTLGGRLISTLQHDDQQWKFGLDLQNNDRNADRFNDGMGGTLQSTLWPGVAINQTGVFAEVSQPISEKGQLTTGLRFDYTKSDASRANTSTAAMTANQLYAMYYDGAQAEARDQSHLGGLIRYERELNEDGLLLYSGFSRTLRVADATERYMASNNSTASNRWVGNPEIDNEKHHLLELGLVQPLDNGGLVEGSVYANRVSDYILRDRYTASGNNATIYRNVDATLTGIELNSNYPLSKQWQLEGGLAYVHATNTTDHRAIAQTPPLEAMVAVNYQSNGYEAGARIRAAATQTRVDTESSSGIDGQGLDVEESSGWAVLDLYGSYAVHDQVSVNFGVDNLFDQNYAQHLNRSSAFDPSQVQVNEPGRSLWLTLNVDF